MNSQKTEWVGEIENTDGSRDTVTVRATTLEQARDKVGSMMLDRGARRCIVVGNVTGDGDIGERGDGWLQ